MLGKVFCLKKIATMQSATLLCRICGWLCYPPLPPRVAAKIKLLATDELEFATNVVVVCFTIQCDSRHNSCLLFIQKQISQSTAIAIIKYL